MVRHHRLAAIQLIALSPWQYYACAMATHSFVLARKTRCKTDRELVLFDYGHGYVEAALEVPDDIPIVIAHASIPEGRARGHWIVAVDEMNNYSDPIHTKAAAIEELDVLAAEARPRVEERERYWRERWPATHEAFKREMLGRAAS